MNLLQRLLVRLLMAIHRLMCWAEVHEAPDVLLDEDADNWIRHHRMRCRHCGRTFES